MTVFIGKPIMEELSYLVLKSAENLLANFSTKTILCLTRREGEARCDPN
jgi:hypothetical protein